MHMADYSVTGRPNPFFTQIFGLNSIFVMGIISYNLLYISVLNFCDSPWNFYPPKIQLPLTDLLIVLTGPLSIRLFHMKTLLRYRKKCARNIEIFSLTRNPLTSASSHCRLYGIDSINCRQFHINYDISWISSIAQWNIKDVLAVTRVKARAVFIVWVII